VDRARARIPLTLVLPALVLAGCPPTISEPRSAEHERALAEGERHMAHGRDDEAVGAFQRAADEAERRVDLDEALYRETRALIALDRHEDTVRILDEVGARRPVSRRTSRAMFEASRIRLEHLGQREAALEGFERVMRETPDDGLGTRALYYILADFEARGDSAAAIEFCTRLYEELGNSTLGDDLLRSRSNLHLLDGRRVEGRADLEALIVRYPYPYGQRWDDAIVTLAELDVEDGEPRRAIERLRGLVFRNEETNLVGSYTLPSMPRAQLRIGEIFRDELHDLDAASEAFEDLEDKFPRSALRDDALYQAGRMWLDAGEDRRGCRILRHLLDDYPVGHPRRLAEELVITHCERD
jgi:tetratricopeptide (TPR) repeat protein